MIRQSNIYSADQIWSVEKMALRCSLPYALYMQNPNRPSKAMDITRGSTIAMNFTTVSTAHEQTTALKKQLPDTTVPINKLIDIKTANFRAINATVVKYFHTYSKTGIDHQSDKKKVLFKKAHGRQATRR